MGRFVCLVGLMLAAAGGLAACASEPDVALLTPYGMGYSDGCDSGYADYGLDFFDYKRGGVFGGGAYGTGWEKGYNDCLTFIRAAAL